MAMAIVIINTRVIAMETRSFFEKHSLFALIGYSLGFSFKY
jgi:hypothetical protein